MTAWNFNELTALTGTLDGIAGRVKPAVTEALVKGGEEVRDLAADIADKDTGHMAESIESTLVISGGGADAAVEVGPTAFYGRYKEHGTAKMPPSPFMGPAAAQKADGIVQSILDAAAGSVLG